MTRTLKDSFAWSAAEDLFIFFTWTEAWECQVIYPQKADAWADLIHFSDQHSRLMNQSESWSPEIKTATCKTQTDHKTENQQQQNILKENSHVAQARTWFPGLLQKSRRPFSFDCDPTCTRASLKIISWRPIRRIAVCWDSVNEHSTTELKD